MDYIYDIVLNFQNKYYDFYEWLPQDRIINITRIVLYKVSTDNYLNIKNHDVIIDKNSLPIKTKMFLLTNDAEVMGILINNNGKVIKKSSLIFEEADDILKRKHNLKKISLQYTIIKKHNPLFQSRIQEEKSEFVKDYFKTINKSKDEYILKYLYYDLYNVMESDVDKIYQELSSIIETNTNKLYNLIHELGIKKIH